MFDVIVFFFFYLYFIIHFFFFLKRFFSRFAAAVRRDGRRFRSANGQRAAGEHNTRTRASAFAYRITLRRASRSGASRNAVAQGRDWKILSGRGVNRKNCAVLTVSKNTNKYFLTNAWYNLKKFRGGRGGYTVADNDRRVRGRPVSGDLFWVRAAVAAKSFFNNFAKLNRSVWTPAPLNHSYSYKT